MTRQAPAVWMRHGMVIRPTSEEADAMLRSFKSGDQFIGRFRKARSIKQNRLWWGLMRILVDHGVFPLIEAASDATKIACGHVEIRVIPDTGEVHMVPRSIAFESLSQADFNPIMEAGLDVVCSRWIKGVEKEALRREIFAAIDGPARIGERTR
jgi:hypothetical protein